MIGTTSKIITIFGATGDLSYRKLMPALYMLSESKKLNKGDRVIAIGRRDFTNESFIENTKSWIKTSIRSEYDDVVFNEFAKRITYLKMDFTEISEYKKLADIFCNGDSSEKLFYYAVAPRFFNTISDGIISLPCIGSPKIIIEKPFGETISEAKSISDKLIKCFGKDNILHIDHYLGKEMVQSILAIRFKNSIFKACWNKDYIDHIKIYACEELGVETRAGYYDKAGALKDMVQNHLMQILSLVAMDEPKNSADIKQKQADAMKRLRTVNKAENMLFLGQYDGYLKEDGVDKESKTETLACMKLYVDSERFDGVPFYLLTGKKMSKKEMNIVVVFKTADEGVSPDTLTFKVQPTEGVYLEFNIKEPGESNKVIRASMDFCQSCNIVFRMNTPEAYERLLYAAISSDNTWFSSWEQIELCWSFVERLKKLYNDEGLSVEKYPQGMCFEADNEGTACPIGGIFKEFMEINRT